MVEHGGRGESEWQTVLNALCLINRVYSPFNESTPKERDFSVLKGLGDLANISSVLKQAVEMKGRIEELRGKLADEQVEASSGGGMVTVTVSGRMELLSLHIEPEVINREDPEMLETLVRAAVNEGLNKMKALVKEKMKEAAGGMDIPGLT
jgi:nucleoid-associated protein EbfC